MAHSVELEEIESVGDSSKDILGNVRRTAKALIQAATSAEERKNQPKPLDDLIR